MGKGLNLCLQVSSADNLYKQVCTQIRPDKMSGLIWIHTVLTLMIFLKEIFEKVDFEKKSADDKQVAQWATIAHLGASIMFGDTLIYDAQRQVTELETVTRHKILCQAVLVICKF